MLQLGMDIKTLVQTYKPPQEAIEIVKANKIALLVGISGAGKDTIKKGMLAMPGFGEIISHTTRAPRENAGVAEVDGVDYHFVTEERAREMLENGEFFEAKFVHGTIYGTSIAEVQRAALEGVAVTDIDVQGVAEYKEASDEVVAIFIIPPNYEEWVSRLKRRYSTEEDFLAEWPKRRETAISELRKALELPYYHCVINDSLERAISVSAEIARRDDDLFNRKDDEARIAARDLLKHISDLSLV